MNTPIKRQVTPYDLFVINTKDGYNDPYKLARKVLLERSKIQSRMIDHMIPLMKALER